jgi:predicted esterase YcpF (UPF0227 family)
MKISDFRLTFGNYSRWISSIFNLQSEIHNPILLPPHRFRTIIRRPNIPLKKETRACQT